MRKIITFVLSLVLIMTGNLSASAMETDDFLQIDNVPIRPQLTYITHCETYLAMGEEGVADISSTVIGNINITTKVSISTEVQRYTNGKWVTIKFFTAANNSYVAGIEQTYPLIKGYSYRVRTTVSVYAENNVESRVLYSGIVTYN